MASGRVRGDAGRIVPKPGVGVARGAVMVAGPIAVFGPMTGGTKGLGAEGEGISVRPAAGLGGAVPGAGEDAAGVADPAGAAVWALGDV